MSLFKTRTFWCTHCDEEETFDQNSLHVTKLNSEFDLIITGSHNGILRIFQPSSELQENHLTQFKATDLLIEKICESPILQVISGRLVSGSTKLQLAVLHPHLLSVYGLIIKEGATDHGVQNILHILYEHKLRRSAYNMVVGPFGGSQNRDFICIQSLDGLLTFYEQESFAFCCFLPDFLLPGPLVFVKKSDSFVISSSNWQLCSFKYKLLSEAGQYSGENDDMGKKVNSDWKFNLGEAAMDIHVVEDPVSRDNFILILGERNIFCLGESGKLKYMKRMEFAPICFENYFLDDKIISMVVSETRNILIYQNTSLKWSAQLQILPVSIKRAFLRHLSGAIVTLSEEGALECSYLGTEPSLFVAPPLAVQDIDFDKTGLELATLHRTIKNSYSNDIKVTNTSAERELTLNISVNSNSQSGSNKGMCAISIEIIPQAPFEEVQIAVFAQYPLKVESAVGFFNNLSEKTVMNCYISLGESGIVVSLNVDVVASFISNLGVPRCTTKSIMLPLNLVAEACPPLKENDCKITLNINQSPVSPAVLFPEFFEESTSNVIAFRNIIDEGKIVTILLAKSSERYRLQSDSLASLNLFVEQMIYRLKKYFANKNDFAITFNSTMPISETLPYVTQHFHARKQVILLQDHLAQLSTQFRLIQKRLIAKFKVKNPTPLSNLELLLNDTLSEIMNTAQSLDQEMNNLEKSQNQLSCALHLLVNLIKLIDGGEKAMGIIESAFSSHIYDCDGQNWEDVMEASLCYLLRTILAKSDKDKLRAAHTSFDEVKDISKIEKHFTHVLERIPKGVLLETDFPIEEGKSLEQQQEGNDNIETVPIGSKIGESSSRLLSARKGLLRKRHKTDNN